MLYWNDKEIAYDKLVERFRGILLKYGLYDNEISDFIEYWLDKNCRIFFGKTEFRYGIYPIPIHQLEKIIQIETKIEYPEVVRVQFLIKEICSSEKTVEPEFQKIEHSGYSLHEWGIIKK